MKKAIAIFAAALMLTACGNKQEDKNSSGSAAEKTASAAESVSSEENAPSGAEASSSGTEEKLDCSVLLTIDGKEIPFADGKDAVAEVLGDEFSVREFETYKLPEGVNEEDLVLVDEHEDMVDDRNIMAVNYLLRNADKHDVTLLGQKGIGITRDQLVNSFPDSVVSYMDSADMICFVNGEPFTYEHTDDIPSEHPRSEELYSMIESGEAGHVVCLYVLRYGDVSWNEIIVTTLEKAPDDPAAKSSEKTSEEKSEDSSES